MTRRFADHRDGFVGFTVGLLMAASTFGQGCASGGRESSLAGNVTGSDASSVPTESREDAATSDAASWQGEVVWVDASTGLGTPGSGDAGSGCPLGEAGSFATDQALNLFGNVVYFANGNALPAGHYRVTYVDGCMKFGSFWAWTVNQDLGTGPDGWWLVGASTSDRVTLLPGTTIINPVTGYDNFDDCVAANKKLPPKEFDFAGGKLGVWLNDTPYTDNVAGESGRNPKWQLTLFAAQCPMVL